MRRIGKEELEVLKRRVDLVALMQSHGVEVKRAGKTYKALCFLHAETTPSLSIDPRTGTWRCFGACTAEGSRGGDAIAFLRLKAGLSFPDALAELLSLYGNGTGGNGSESRSKSPAPEREKRPAEPLADAERAQLLEAVASHYEATLGRSSRAQRYLEKRAVFVPEILRACRVGFADGSLVDAVAPKGETRAQLVSLGVLTEEGREVLTGFVVVPLVEPKSGAVLQLYGRAITGNHHLYLKGDMRGLVNGARAMASEELVVVESVLDALSLLAVGIANVVPIYGVNGWTRDHDRLLEHGAVKTVTLLLDSDAAGKRASETLGERLLQHGLRVRVAKLDDHKDPNDALVAGVTADEMRQVLDDAVPLGPAMPQAEAPEAPRSALRYELEDVDGGFLVMFGARRYRVKPLAGVGLKQLGALRLKLEDSYGSYLDTLDLGLARARRGFARNAARRFGADEESIEGELDALVEIAEGWIASKTKGEEGASSRPAPPELSEEQRAEALAFLRAPKLLERCIEHMSRLGYVGEDVNKALGYLVVVSRKLEDPLSVLVLSQSGAGKSGLTEVLERIVPPEDVILYSRLTTNALYYMPRDFLRRKVVIIEERSGSEEADYSLRTLQSRKKLVLGVPVKDPRTGRTETKTIEVEGPAVFLQTSTATDINYENSTRCFELYLDESVEQTRRIHAQQRLSKTLPAQDQAAENEKLVALHGNVQRLLEPVRVHIPFVDAITFPDAWLRTRRDHLRFLNLIEASAFLHQYQRPRPKGTEGAIEASAEDYRIAYRLAREVLGSTLADLKKPARALLEAMRTVLAELGRKQKLPPERVTVTRRELRERTGLPDHQVRRLLADLVALEHVVLVNGSQGRLCSYRLADGGEGAPAAVLRGLLTPEELERKLRS